MGLPVTEDGEQLEFVVVLGAMAASACFSERTLWLLSTIVVTPWSRGSRGGEGLVVQRGHGTQRQAANVDPQWVNVKPMRWGHHKPM